MALYSMYPQSSSQLIYQDSQRARQHALQSQLGYYSDQHPVHQPQGLGLTDATPNYSRPYATAYDHMSLGYPIPQPTYASGLAMPEDMHHGYPYPRLLQSGLLPGMPDEADTASRPRLTAEQTRELEALYAANSKPSTQQKQEYAQRFRLTKNRVDNWFQNRRAKSKHQNKAKQTELALANVSSSQSRSSSKEVSENKEYPAYPYRNALSSQNTSLDLLASAPFNKEQDQDLGSEDDYVPADQTSWKSQNDRATRQSSAAHTEYSHGSEYANKHVLGSEPCQSPSPVSLKSYDYPVTTTYSSQGHVSAEYPPEAFARRGSNLSDLTSHMNGIQMPSEQSSSRDMFHIEPRRGFGDRRPQRPAALGTMRSTSSGSTLRSPLMTINTLPKSLRRINTCGTALNKTGRIQKYGTITPSKSPRALSQALERAMDQLTPHIADVAHSPHDIDAIEDAHGEKDNTDAAVIFNVNPPSADVSWNDNVNADFPVPPLSASLTGDDGSPPITPLTGQESFTNPWSNQEISTVTTTSIPTYTHPSPILLQDTGACLSSQQSHHSLNQFWDGTSVSDMFSMSGSSFDYGGPNSAAAAHVSRPESFGSSSHYGYSSSSNNSGMSSRRLNEPLKIEFSHPHQEAQSHYYVPLRGNQNYVFHEYNPDHARRFE